MSDQAPVAGASIRQLVKPHAIQLVSLKFSDIEIHTDMGQERDATPPQLGLENSRTAYDAETRRIQVRLRAFSGIDNPEHRTVVEGTPYWFVITVHGMFEVDTTRFKAEHVEPWAETNAPLVLYPYVREVAFSLTGRMGFPEAILPLMEIPTFRVVAPEGAGPVAKIPESKT
jgi:preprotein translocase subunit SecB